MNLTAAEIDAPGGGEWSRCWFFWWRRLMQQLELPAAETGAGDAAFSGVRSGL